MTKQEALNKAIEVAKAAASSGADHRQQPKNVIEEVYQTIIALDEDHQ